MGEIDPWDSIAVSADREVPGRWHATLDDVWLTAMVPLGGLTAAVAAEAMAAELAVRHPGAAEQRLRSVHFLFVAPVPSGPVTADVSILRAGRSMSQAQVTVRAPGAENGLTALGAFGAPRTGYQFSQLVPPDVPLPDDCPSYRDPIPDDADWDPGPRRPMFEFVLEGRAALGLPPWDRSPRTDAESATWQRFDQPPPIVDGRYHSAASLVIGDLMLNAIGQRIGYTTKPWFGPSVDLTVHLFAPPRPGWILSHHKGRVAGDGYASLENTVWGVGPSGEPGDFELVAHCTQQMVFSFPDGPPPADELDL